jgi:tetratricopeptide (TPR) repeat protein
MSQGGAPAPPGSSAQALPLPLRAPRRRPQIDRESNYHRLSRFPDRFNAKPAPLQDNSNGYTPFATNYFKMNPDAEDLTAPEDKLVSLNQQLKSGLSSAQKFTALNQKKTMIYLLNGDESSEMFDILSELGLFYADNDRPDSAIRHLSQAQGLEDKIEVPEESSLSVAVVLAESHLRLDSKRKQHIDAAEKSIEKFTDKEIEDSDMKLRLALVRGRIFREKRQMKLAGEQYTIVLDGIETDWTDGAIAKVAVEAAEVYEGLEQRERAIDCYKSARDRFARIEMNDVVAGLDAKVAALESAADRELAGAGDLSSGSVSQSSEQTDE